ncbi:MULTISPECIES: hypothetical protein [Pandoraea]|uniref:hypothetical protein n=1 Tax=Pandoraea TaxID=93217 RepID=UPI001F5C44F7|nr:MULTISPECIES: hypothetical protein [Pandoraea]MCI3205881.1 hypothetical protein [Pandoraea sp. LA3]MDN4583909.1 hypothetical protein [Pandoraea capi]
MSTSSSASASAAAGFAPFANDADALTLGELNVENHTDHVAIFGNIELRRDAEGLRQAQALKAVVDAIVATLASADLPERVQTPAGTTAKPVRNPFES